MNKLFTATILFGLASVSTVNIVDAVSLPFKLHLEQNIDTHQVGWFDLNIGPQGNGTLTHSWSNGKHTSGNTFYSVVVLVDKNGKSIYSDKQTKGIDGSWGGHAREGHVTTQFKLTPEAAASVDHAVFKAGVTNCGMEVSSFKCCDNGIEIGFSTRKC
jgi:hypothetical protein